VIAFVNDKDEVVLPDLAASTFLRLTGSWPLERDSGTLDEEFSASLVIKVIETMNTMTLGIL
jgi:hypothetical protein